MWVWFLLLPGEQEGKEAAGGEPLSPEAPGLHLHPLLAPGRPESPETRGSGAGQGQRVERGPGLPLIYSHKDLSTVLCPLHHLCRAGPSLFGEPGL